MVWITDTAVRRKGEGNGVAIRYCVMCLADGEKVPAVCVIDIGDEGVEAGYCRLCAETMKKHGHVLKAILGDKMTRAYTQRKGKLTDEQRAEIVVSREPAGTLAERYGVHWTTIYDVRKKAKQQVLSTAVAEHGPEAVEEAVEVVPSSYWQALQDSGIFAGIERHAAPAAPEPEPAVEVVQADVPVEAIKRREADDAEIAAEYRKWQDENKVYATEPVNRNQEALRRVICEGEAGIADAGCGCSCHRYNNTVACLDCGLSHPGSKSFSYLKQKETEPATVSITLNLTHETANAIWGGLTLEEKATFCRTKIIERLELLA